MRGEDWEKYRDIIGLPHHVSPTRPHMSNAERAAQFSPFAALTGHSEAVRETGRLTEKRRELDEDSRLLLDRKLELIRRHQAEKPQVTVSYFRPDEQKEGGAYVSVHGRLRRIDEYGKKLIFEDGLEIPAGQIADMTGEIFDAAEEP